MKTLAWLLMLTMLLAGTVFAGELKRKVIRVADGDTLTILIEPIKLDMPVRLSGIDAPEKGMQFGQVSKTSLSDLAFGKPATVLWVKKDNTDVGGLGLWSPPAELAVTDRSSVTSGNCVGRHHGRQ